MPIYDNDAVRSKLIAAGFVELHTVTGIGEEHRPYVDHHQEPQKSVSKWSRTIGGVETRFTLYEWTDIPPIIEDVEGNVIDPDTFSVL